MCESRKTHVIICPRSEFFIVQGKIRGNDIEYCNSCPKKKSVSEGAKRKSCCYNAGRQEVSRFRTRGESEEFTANRQGNTQVRDLFCLCNPGQTSLEFQNSSISGPHKKDWWPQFSCLVFWSWFFQKKMSLFTSWWVPNNTLAGYKSSRMRGRQS